MAPQVACLDYSIAKQGMAMAAMFGGGPDIEIPDNLNPIGLAMATGGGGVQTRVHVPTNVLKLIASVAEMQAGMRGEPDEGPRF